MRRILKYGNTDCSSNIKFTLFICRKTAVEDVLLIVLELFGEAQYMQGGNQGGVFLLAFTLKGVRIDVGFL